MKNKFQQIEEKLEAARADRVKAELDVEAAETALADMQAESLKIAAAGDLGRFKEAKQRISDLETVLEMKKAVLKTKMSDAIGGKEISDAWKQFINSSEKELAEAIENYKKQRDKQRRELYSQFTAILNLQNDILIMREKCEELSGKPQECFPVTMFIPVDFRDDQNFFQRAGFFDINKSCAIGALIQNHTINRTSF